MSSRKNATITLTSSTQLLHRNLLSLPIRVDGSGFFTGSKDKTIYKVDLLGNPLRMYEGHEAPVNSLSQCINEELVSGSWDG